MAEAPPPGVGVAVFAPSEESSEPQADSAPGRASASSTRSSRVVVIGRGRAPGAEDGAAAILPAALDGRAGSDPGGAPRGGVRGVLERVVERRELVRVEPERG